MSDQNPIKTSRPVFDDPIDQNRYCVQEYGTVAALNGSDPEREKNWRRWCWYLARLDGFPESCSHVTGEVVGPGRASWTAFCQQAALDSLADAMVNRHEAARRTGPQKGRAA